MLFAMNTDDHNVTKFQVIQSNIKRCGNNLFIFNHVTNFTHRRAYIHRVFSCLLLISLNYVLLKQFAN